MVAGPMTGPDTGESLYSGWGQFQGSSNLFIGHDPGREIAACSNDPRSNHDPNPDLYQRNCSDFLWDGIIGSLGKQVNQAVVQTVRLIAFCPYPCYVFPVCSLVLLESASICYREHRA